MGSCSDRSAWAQAAEELDGGIIDEPGEHAAREDHARDAGPMM
jgi:hypothetical protein